MKTVEQKLLETIKRYGIIINRISDTEYEVMLDHQDYYIVKGDRVKRSNNERNSG